MDERKYYKMTPCMCGSNDFWLYSLKYNTGYVHEDGMVLCKETYICKDCGNARIRYEYALKETTPEYNYGDIVCMGNALLPCPFCGGEVEFHPQEHHMNNMWNKNTICCPTCNMSMQETSKMKLIERWNRRQEDVNWENCHKL